jgi:transposase
MIFSIAPPYTILASYYEWKTKNIFHLAQNPSLCYTLSNSPTNLKRKIAMDTKKKSISPALAEGFSAKQQALIKKLRKDGKSIRAIAKELHVSDRRVAKFAKFGNVVDPPAPKPSAPKTQDMGNQKLRDQVVALRSKGLSIKAIAKKLHKSDKTVASIVGQTGIGAPSKSVAQPKNGDIEIRNIPGTNLTVVKISGKAALDAQKHMEQEMAILLRESTKVQKMMEELFGEFSRAFL